MNAPITAPGPVRPARLLRGLGLRAQRRFSQTFLGDEGVCQIMADQADLSRTDQVLEIGPGLGILTRVLLSRAKRVVAVELDRRLAAVLPGLCPSDALEVVEADAVRFDPADYFDSDYKLVANLPYQITSPVLNRFLVEVRRPEVMVVMVQREVAERIAAPPGSSSYLSILIQSLADVRTVQRVPPAAFYPRPKVDSAVVWIRPRRDAAVPEELRSQFLTLVRAGFAQPRKTLANSLAQGLRIDRAAADSWIRAAGQSSGARPQHLGVADWLALLRAAPLPA